MKHALFTLAVALVSAAAVPATPAQAQTRVFVAAQGLDTNPCTFAQPCRTFQHAHDVLAPNGEIDVLDPAGYGAVNITKSISIQGHGFSGITVTAGNAISVNAPADAIINLSGLIIEGAGAGLNGIQFNTGKSLTIENCVIRRVTQYAIEFAPNASSAIAVSDTLIIDNFFGVYVHPSGSAAVTALFNRVGVYNSAIHAIDIEGGATSGLLNATIADSVAYNNGGHGFVVFESGAVAANSYLMVVRSVSANNASFGVGDRKSVV